ncbi:metal-dependent hydrolase [soil metagenome]
MDPITHGVVGAMAAYTISDKKARKSAPVAGAGSAMLADIETFMHLPSDPLFNLEVHRQFTHSLVFIPVGALIATALFWFLLRRHLSFKQLYIYSIAGYATHWFMDVITSYGTELFWPFVNTRYAWNLVSVVDPLFSAGLILFTALALWYNRKWLIGAAWGWMILILAAGWIQNERADRTMNLLAEERGHSLERSVVKPTLGNQILWRATYISRDSVFTDAVRAGLYSSPTIYSGESYPLVDISEEFQAYRGTTLYSDLKRFERLSEGYLIRHPQLPEVIGDARYSMLPTSLVPLWGVATDTLQSDSHLPFLYFRDAGAEIREPFLNMLMGRENRLEAINYEN